MMVPVIVMIGAGLTVIIAMIYDIRQGIIPNFLNIVSMFGGILFHTLWCQGVIWSVKGLAAGLCIFLLPYLLGGMGAGDVKLFGAMGTWLGWRGVLFTALFSAFSAGVMALAAIFLHGGRKGVGVRIYMAVITRRLPAPLPERPILYTPSVAIGLSLFLFWSWS